MYDVIVVGAGPAGSATAKKCAELGLKALLLEKRQLPRDKVCSGMIMGPVSHTLIKQEFGSIPGTVLTQPSQLAGYIFYASGSGSEKLDNDTPLTWRRKLDYWLCQKAEAGGAEVWQGALTVSAKQERKGFSVVVVRGKEQVVLESRFLVGADGATSVVRKSLFPEVKMRYSQVYQEHYRCELDLDKSYFHWFYPVELFPTSFTAHHKDGLLIVDVGGRVGQMKDVMKWARDFLARNCHFDARQKPVWRGSCLQAVIFRELTSHTFKPARGNALLVGDAGGLTMPVSGEGIGLGLKSALVAASAIKRGVETGESAEPTYLAGIEGIISLFGEVYPSFRLMADEAKSGGRSLARLVRETYLSTLRPF